MRITDKYIFFNSGAFSQWYGASFMVNVTNKSFKNYEIQVNEEILEGVIGKLHGLVFPTAEHFMMYCKAKLMKDEERAKLIMLAKSPKEAKRLGREVTNFEMAIWDRYKLVVALLGNFYKVTQNREIFNNMQNLYLIDPNLEYVEASYDTIWGIGIKETDDRVLNSDLWEGHNLLGVTLTKLSKIIFDNENCGL